MSRIADLLASSSTVPTQSDPEFANYNTLEQRLLVKCGGDKETLLQLYRRVKRRSGAYSAAGIGLTVVEGSGVCITAATGEELISDSPRLSGGYGEGLKQNGNELFVGETGAVGSIFQVGEVHYYTRPNAESNWTRQSGFFSPSQTNAGLFGRAIDYDGARVAVGEPGGNTVDVFTFSGGTETHEQQITPNFVDAGQQFGLQVAIHGSHMLIGAPNADDSLTSEGNVEYWSESGGTWTFQQRIQSNAGAETGAYFGQGIAMTDSSTAYIVRNPSGTAFIEKWTRSGSTWTFDSQVELSDYSMPSGSNPCRLDTDGTSLILSNNGYDVATATNEGIVLVMDTDGNVTTEIIGDAGQSLGSDATVDGSEAVIGQSGYDGTKTNQGRALVWNVCV